MIEVIESRIERYQKERAEQFARWNNYEITREEARAAIRTLTRWIEMLGSVKV